MPWLLLLLLCCACGGTVPTPIRFSLSSAALAALEEPGVSLRAVGLYVVSPGSLSVSLGCSSCSLALERETTPPLALYLPAGVPGRALRLVGSQAAVNAALREVRVLPGPGGASAGGAAPLLHLSAVPWVAEDGGAEPWLGADAAATATVSFALQQREGAQAAHESPAAAAEAGDLVPAAAAARGLSGAAVAPPASPPALLWRGGPAVPLQSLLALPPWPGAAAGALTLAASTASPGSATGVALWLPASALWGLQVVASTPASGVFSSPCTPLQALPAGAPPQQALLTLLLGACVTSLTLSGPTEALETAALAARVAFEGSFWGNASVSLSLSAAGLLEPVGAWQPLAVLPQNSPPLLSSSANASELLVLAAAAPGSAAGAQAAPLAPLLLRISDLDAQSSSWGNDTGSASISSLSGPPPGFPAACLPAGAAAPAAIALYTLACAASSPRLRLVLAPSSLPLPFRLVLVSNSSSSSSASSGSGPGARLVFQGPLLSLNALLSRAVGGIEVQWAPQAAPPAELQGSEGELWVEVSVSDNGAWGCGADGASPAPPLAILQRFPVRVQVPQAGSEDTGTHLPSAPDAGAAAPAGAPAPPSSLPFLDFAPANTSSGVAGLARMQVPLAGAVLPECFTASALLASPAFPIPIATQTPLQGVEAQVVTLVVAAWGGELTLGSWEGAQQQRQGLLSVTSLAGLPSAAAAKCARELWAHALPSASGAGAGTDAALLPLAPPFCCSALAPRLAAWYDVEAWLTLSSSSSSTRAQASSVQWAAPLPPTSTRVLRGSVQDLRAALGAGTAFSFSPQRAHPAAPAPPATPFLLALTALPDNTTSGAVASLALALEFVRSSTPAASAGIAALTWGSPACADTFAPNSSLALLQPVWDDAGAGSAVAFPTLDLWQAAPVVGAPQTALEPLLLLSVTVEPAVGRLRLSPNASALAGTLGIYCTAAPGGAPSLQAQAQLPLPLPPAAILLACQGTRAALKVLASVPGFLMWDPPGTLFTAFLQPAGKLVGVNATLSIASSAAAVAGGMPVTSLAASASLRVGSRPPLPQLLSTGTACYARVASAASNAAGILTVYACAPPGGARASLGSPLSPTAFASAVTLSSSSSGSGSAPSLCPMGFPCSFMASNPLTLNATLSHPTLTSQLSVLAPPMCAFNSSAMSIGSASGGAGALGTVKPVLSLLTPSSVLPLAWTSFSVTGVNAELSVFLHSLRLHCSSAGPPPLQRNVTLALFQLPMTSGGLDAAAPSPLYAQKTIGSASYVFLLPPFPSAAAAGEGGASASGTAAPPLIPLFISATSSVNASTTLPSPPPSPSSPPLPSAAPTPLSSYLCFSLQGSSSSSSSTGNCTGATELTYTLPSTSLTLLPLHFLTASLMQLNSASSASSASSSNNSLTLSTPPPCTLSLAASATTMPARPLLSTALGEKGLTLTGTWEALREWVQWGVALTLPLNHTAFVLSITQPGTLAAPFTLNLVRGRGAAAAPASTANSKVLTLVSASTPVADLGAQTSPCITVFTSPPPASAAPPASPSASFLTLQVTVTRGGTLLLPGCDSNTCTSLLGGAVSVLDSTPTSALLLSDFSGLQQLLELHKGSTDACLRAALPATASNGSAFTPIPFATVDMALVPSTGAGGGGFSSPPLAIPVLFPPLPARGSGAPVEATTALPLALPCWGEAPGIHLPPALILAASQGIQDAWLAAMAATGDAQLPQSLNLTLSASGVVLDLPAPLPVSLGGGTLVVLQRQEALGGSARSLPYLILQAASHIPLTAALSYLQLSTPATAAAALGSSSSSNSSSSSSTTTALTLELCWWSSPGGADSSQCRTAHMLLVLLPTPTPCVAGRSIPASASAASTPAAVHAQSGAVEESTAHLERLSRALEQEAAASAPSPTSSPPPAYSCPLFFSSSPPPVLLPAPHSMPPTLFPPAFTLPTLQLPVNASTRTAAQCARAVTLSVTIGGAQAAVGSSGMAPGPAALLLALPPPLLTGLVTVRYSYASSATPSTLPSSLAHAFRVQVAGAASLASSSPAPVYFYASAAEQGEDEGAIHALTSSNPSSLLPPYLAGTSLDAATATPGDFALALQAALLTALGLPQDTLNTSLAVFADGSVRVGPVQAWASPTAGNALTLLTSVDAAWAMAARARARLPAATRLTLQLSPLPSAPSAAEVHVWSHPIPPATLPLTCFSLLSPLPGMPHAPPPQVLPSTPSPSFFSPTPTRITFSVPDAGIPLPTTFVWVPLAGSATVFSHQSSGVPTPLAFALGTPSQQLPLGSVTRLVLSPAAAPAAAAPLPISPFLFCAPCCHPSPPPSCCPSQPPFTPPAIGMEGMRVCHCPFHPPCGCS